MGRQLSVSSLFFDDFRDLYHEPICSIALINLGSLPLSDSICSIVSVINSWSLPWSDSYLFHRFDKFGQVHSSWDLIVLFNVWSQNHGQNGDQSHGLIFTLINRFLCGSFVLRPWSDRYPFHRCDKFIQFRFSWDLMLLSYDLKSWLSDLLQ